MSIGFLYPSEINSNASRNMVRKDDHKPSAEMFSIILFATRIMLT